MPSPGYRVSGKEVEVRDSGSRHHQLCGCCNLQLIQSRVAPSHGPAARVLSPLSLWLQSLYCCLSRVAKRSTPKPRGPLPFPSEPHGPSYLLQNCVALSLSPQNRVVLSFYFRTTWPSSFPLRTSWFSSFTSEPHGPLSIYLLQNLVGLLFPSEPHGLLPSMAAGPRFKSQCPSSFAAPFLTPLTVSYTCQHPCILPPLLGCHSKSGQVWPHGVEPIISKLSRRPCNQGELLPRPGLDGSHSHLPGSKQGHSYLTYP